MNSAGKKPNGAERTSSSGTEDEKDHEAAQSILRAQKRVKSKEKKRHIYFITKEYTNG